MARTVGDTSTSVDSWWFLNPELSQLAKPALVLVTQWTWHEKAAKELLWEGAARGSIRWYAEIEIQEDNPVFKTRAGLLTFNTAVNQGLWHPHYFTMDWEASRGIYLGPAILLIRNPECPEEMHVRYDGRASTHIVARLMRFHRGDMAAHARRSGLLAAPLAPSSAATSEVAPLTSSSSEPSPQGQPTCEQPQGWQAERTLRFLRKHYPEGKTSRKQTHKVLRAECRRPRRGRGKQKT